MKLPKVPKGIPKKIPPRVAPSFRPAPPRLSPLPRRPENLSIPKPPLRPDASEPPPRPPPRRQPIEPEYEPLPESRLSEQEILAEREAVRNAERTRRRQVRGLTACGLLVFGMGLYLSLLYTSLTGDVPEEELPDDTTAVFDKEAAGYDEKVGMAETMIGLNRRRKAITGMVKGHVLENAVGTGRNFPYYPIKQCDTVTLLDPSGPMLDVAKRKWKDAQPEFFGRSFFKQQSALDPLVPPYGAQDGYDTVLQTMGLCSTPEPVRLLQNLEAATKEGGQILLLEHGKSHYEWLNKLLDQSAPNHAKEHGCWWNKDIGKIVEESGLEVVNIKRYNFGTTWWVELKPRKGMRKLLAKEALAPVSASPDAPQESWWSLWR